MSLGVVATGVCAASRLVERCSSGFFGSCIRLIAACVSAAFTCAVFLSLLSVGGVGVARPRKCACCFLLGPCVALALLVLVLRVLDAAGRVLGGARDGLAEAFACFCVVACGGFGVVCAERGLGCAHVVVEFNVVQCGEVAEVKVVVVVDEVSVLVCVPLEEADGRERHGVPVVGCYCLAEGVRCAIEGGVLGAVGAALGIGDKRERLREVGVDGEFLPFFAVA